METYLYREPYFLEMTDNQSLHWLMCLREPRRRLTRRLVKVKDYCYVVEYDTGKIIVVADTLNRDCQELTEIFKLQ